MTQAIVKGTIPIRTSGTATLFATHWRVRPTKVETTEGETFETGYLVLDRGSFNLYELCGRTTPPNGVFIDSVLYVDENDMAHDLPMQSHNAIVTKEFHVVTKVLDKRWGVKLTIDQDSGVVTLKGDLESPIIGVKLRLA